MRYVLLVVGGLMALVGGVWIVQGVGILPGSFMTGEPFWAIMGVLVLIAGALLILSGARSGSRPR